MYNIINYIVEAFKKFGHFPPEHKQKNCIFSTTLTLLEQSLKKIYLEFETNFKNRI